ncbi:hypothetical protein J9M50_004085 [Salmonella enterica]|nr:hypothetical protein [Salmonella enterica]EHI9910492.1 hypothetical protein [Salmonella enterica]EHJ0909968.1 hypothetical protein [Salmonella enterica]
MDDVIQSNKGGENQKPPARKKGFTLLRYRFGFIAKTYPKHKKDSVFSFLYSLSIFLGVTGVTGVTFMILKCFFCYTFVFKGVTGVTDSGYLIDFKCVTPVTPT